MYGSVRGVPGNRHSYRDPKEVNGKERVFFIFGSPFRSPRCTAPIGGLLFLAPVLTNSILVYFMLQLVNYHTDKNHVTGAPSTMSASINGRLYAESEGIGHGACFHLLLLVS